MSGRRAVVAVGVVGAMFSLAVLAVPTLFFAVRSTALHVAIEISAGWVALSAGVLLSGRLRRQARLPDAVLLLAFALYGLSNVGLSAVGATVSGVPSGDGELVWATLAGRLLASLCFAAAAFVPDRRLPAGRWDLRGLGLGAAVVLAVLGVVAALGDRLPAGVWLDGALPTGVGGDSLPVAALTQAVMAVAYSTAVVGFLRRERRRDDPMLPWLAAASAVSALARVHYFVFPSLYSEMLYSGDLLRISFNVLLAGAVLAELRRTWRDLGVAAAAEERRRIARDLHDGLAQELAFITTQATWLARRLPDEPRTALLASSAQRALDESRSAIAALTGGPPLTVQAAVTRAVEDVGSRYQQHVRVHVDPALDCPPALCEQLVRIVREAVGNAARHADPSEVAVVLSGGETLLLEVRDDGAGFDPEAAAREGLRFGLRSMRERAEALGGTMRVESAPGGGSAIVVEVPWSP